jgi:hypothetical protein
MVANPERTHEDAPNAEIVSDLVWQAFKTGGAFVRRRNGELWKFATRLAEVKADGGLLDPVRRGMILGHMAAHPCVQWADLWVPVPNGMNQDVVLMGEVFKDRQTAMLVRPDRSKMYEFEFVDDEQRDRVEAATQVTLFEDVSTTGSTAYHLARLLRMVNPGLRIHSLSWLQRSDVRPEYTRGEEAVQYHTMCRRDIPTERAAFVEELGFEPTLV